MKTLVAISMLAVAVLAKDIVKRQVASTNPLEMQYMELANTVDVLQAKLSTLESQLGKLITQNQ